MTYVPLTPAVHKSSEEILEGLRNSVADVESLVMAYVARDPAMSSHGAWLQERARRLYLMTCLRSLQQELLKVRHLIPQNVSASWTACIQIVDTALKGEGA